MKSIFPHLIKLMMSSLAMGYASAAPLIVLKLDDMNVVDGRLPERWKRLTGFVEKRHIPTSIGIICNSLEGDHPEYIAELKRLAATGFIEFWHHGYDHKRWDEDGATLCEFSGTNKEHQQSHFKLAQDLAKKKLGLTFRTFGAPFNATDTTTVEVLSAQADIRVWLQGDAGNKGGKLVIRFVDSVNIEQPVHHPNYDAFVKGYDKHRAEPPRCYVIQGHPNSWDEDSFKEFTRIIDFLTAEKCGFVLPADLPELLK